MGTGIRDGGHCLGCGGCLRNHKLDRHGAKQEDSFFPSSCTLGWHGQSSRPSRLLLRLPRTMMKELPARNKSVSPHHALPRNATTPKVSIRSTDLSCTPNQHQYFGAIRAFNSSLPHTLPTSFSCSYSSDSAFDIRHSLPVSLPRHPPPSPPSS